MLKYRVISGGTLGALLLLSVFWAAPAAGLLCIFLGALLVALSLREYFGITKLLGYPGFPRLTTFAGVVLMVSIGLFGLLIRLAYRPRPDSIMRSLLDHQGRQQVVVAFILGVFLLAAFIHVFRSPDYKKGVMNLLVSLAGYVYLCWTLSFLLRIYYFAPPGQEGFPGPFLLFFVVTVTKSGDMGGYFVGSLSARLPGGNHKMVPRLSPGKSWEGLAGTVLFSAVVAAGLMYLPGNVKIFSGHGGAIEVVPNIAYAAALGVGLALLGLVGDLAESALKRAAELKDSGSALPGMGGMLDTLDSLVLALPGFYCYLVLMTG